MGINMEVLRLISVTKVYQNGNGVLKALDDVSLSIDEGEFIAITGASGSGKTTLLNLIGGLEYPSEGLIFIKGINTSDLTEEERTEFRRNHIGFIFQSYNLLPIINVYENIVLPVRLDGRMPELEFVHKIASALGIDDKLFQMPATLSGGEQQRTAIARALCIRPAIILADEPTGNLDFKTSTQVMNLMKQIGEQFGQTVVVVTHDRRMAEIADRIIEIQDGKVYATNHK